jgi:hypothetical protein
VTCAQPCNLLAAANAAGWAADEGAADIGAGEEEAADEGLDKPGLFMAESADAGAKAAVAATLEADGAAATPKECLSGA